MEKLNIPVPQEGYSIDDGQAVLMAKLNSGPSRFRLDMLGAPLVISISLMLEPYQYQYWRAFYRSTITRGSLPFLLDLVVEDQAVDEYQVQIMPGTLRTSIRGTVHIVEFQVEAKTAQDDPEEDATILMLYDLYGVEAADILNLLAKLANVDLPHGLA